MRAIGLGAVLCCLNPITAVEPAVAADNPSHPDCAREGAIAHFLDGRWRCSGSSKAFVTELCGRGRLLGSDGECFSAITIPLDTSAATECIGGEVLLGDGSCVDISALLAPLPLERWVDNGDGTVTDHDTGLMWEKKTDDGGIHDRDNRYTWSAAPGRTAAQGTVFNEFLGTLNADATDDPNQVGFAGYTDWRLPNIVELQTLLHCRFGPPCIEPVFGPGGAAFYWSSTSSAANPRNAWGVDFGTGVAELANKAGARYVRAVRDVRD